MQLDEILEQVDTLVPNALPATMKVSWINQILNQLYRDYPVPDAVYLFKTVAGKPAYKLPPTCPPDRVRYLVIDDFQYAFVPISESDTNKEHFFTIVVTGDMLIFPVPIEAEQAVLYYRPRPEQLTANDFSKSPSFPEDFHELFVYGCAARVAKVSQDTIGLASLYEADFQRLSDRARRVLVKPKQFRVQVVKSWV